MSDVDKWDRRYLRKEHGNDLTPDPLLVECKGLFKKSHLVVDLACGTGRNSVYLAQLGCHAVALDCSREALRRCQSLAQQSSLNLLAVVADLNMTRFPRESVDAFICFNYLNRELAGNIQTALKADGLLLMKTFNQNFLNVNPRFNSDYVLKPGDLAAMFDKLQIVALDDDCIPASNTKSFIVARKFQ